MEIASGMRTKAGPARSLKVTFDFHLLEPKNSLKFTQIIVSFIVEPRF